MMCARVTSEGVDESYEDEEILNSFTVGAASGLGDRLVDEGVCEARVEALERGDSPRGDNFQIIASVRALRIIFSQIKQHKSNVLAPFSENQRVS